MNERLAIIEECLDEAALGRWAAAHVEHFHGPFTLTKFAGGHSNPICRIDAASGCDVLGREPFGGLLPFAHAVDREYRLIAALHPTGSRCRVLMRSARTAASAGPCFT
jgi:aminoglycoside phosphotransferase (APT) family kinase protein